MAFVVIVCATFGLLIAGTRPAASTEAPTEPTSATVRILADRLDPESVEVEPGATVVWVNESGTESSVLATDASFDSGELKRGGQFQFAFTEAGTASYTVGSLPGVTGTVVIRVAALPDAVTSPGVDPTATRQQGFAYTGAGAALTGAAGGAVLAMGAALVLSARRIGMVALSGLSSLLAPDDLLPSRRHRRALKARARRARSRH